MKFLLLLLTFSVSCEAYKSGGQFYVSVLQNRKIITARDSQGTGAIGPLAAATNAGGKSLTISAREDNSDASLPTVRIVGKDGSSFTTYGTQDQTTGVAEVGNAATNLGFIYAMWQTWRQLIGETFGAINTDTAAGVDKAAIEAAKQIKLAP